MLNNNILIIEDDITTVELIRRILRDEEYKIFSASDGKEGLDLFKKEKPILVILDIEMPVMNGIEFLEHLKPEPSDSYNIIVITGHDETEYIKKTFELGVSSFLCKPLNVDIIKGTIKNSINLKKAELEVVKYSNNLESMVNERTKELKKAYKDLEASHAMVLQQEKLASLGQLAAGVAHEINNPTGFMISNLNTLNKYIEKIIKFNDVQKSAIESSNMEDIIETVEKKRKELKIDYVLKDIKPLISESLNGGDRIKKIVQDLKIFARQDDEKGDYADINKCIESSLNMVWNELKYKCEVKKELNSIGMTYCYPQQLNQVFMNILINASQAIEDHGEIIIKTWQEGDSIFISISDTGSGIAKENIDKVFDPFFTTKEAGKGTGIGMNISYNIIKKHNGDITIMSELGKGTTFTINIPVIDSE